jgi:hypothetical protein
MGAVGLLAYLALVRASWQLLSAAARHDGDPLRADLALFIQAAFVVLAISAQVHDIMYVSDAQIVFFFLMGIVAHNPDPAAA